MNNNLVGKWISWGTKLALVEAVEEHTYVLNTDGKKTVHSIYCILTPLSDDFVRKVAEGTNNKFILEKLEVPQAQKYILITKYPYAGLLYNLSVGKVYKVMAETATALLVRGDKENVGFVKTESWFEYVPESFYTK